MKENEKGLTKKEEEEEEVGGVEKQTSTMGLQQTTWFPKSRKSALVAYTIEQSGWIKMKKY